MALVILVVLGHSWTLLPLNLTDGGSSTATQVDTWLYNFLYAWHIPAFVIVTGYLSKSFEYTRMRMWTLVTTVAVPYVLFEGVYALYRHAVGGVDFERLWANPHWPMWYLSAMFFWRLMTPIFKRMPGKVVVAVAISLLAGLYANDIFDNARIFGLLPFFVLGPEDARGPLEPAAHPSRALVRHRRAGRPVRASPGSPGSWIETEWLYYRSRYDSLDPDNLRAIVDPDVPAARGPGRLVRVLRGRAADEDLVLRARRRHPGGLPVPRLLRARRRVRRLQGLGRGPLAALADPGHGAGAAAGAVPGLAAGLEPAERVRRPDRGVQPASGSSKRADQAPSSG